MISCSVVFKAPYWRSAVIQACIHLIFLLAAEDDQVITSLEDERHSLIEAVGFPVPSDRTANGHMH